LSIELLREKEQMVRRTIAEILQSNERDRLDKETIDKFFQDLMTEKIGPSELL
jgi:uncharacterized protein YaaN involved in tellurite resistance